MNTEDEVTTEEKEQAQRLVNVAVSIAGEVTKYVTREVNKLRGHSMYGKLDPFMAEEMVFSYAIALSNYSLYRVINDPNKQWEQFEDKAMLAVRIALGHMSKEVEKENRICLI